MIVNNREGRIRSKRNAPHHHFVKHHAKGINICAGVKVFFAHRLFGRNILRRSHNRIGRHGRFARVGNPRQTEICEIHLSVRRDHHIRRFNVAVQNSLPMRVRQRISHRVDHALNFFRSQRTLTQTRLERIAFDVFHHQVRATFMFGVIVDRNNIGMFQPRHHPRFALKAHGESLVLIECGMQDFQRDIAIQRRVIGFIYGCHTALPQLLNDPIRTYVFADVERHSNSPLAIFFDYSRALLIWVIWAYIVCKLKQS